jgi:DNA-binding NarL/FixJ family response regulator
VIVDDHPLFRAALAQVIPQCLDNAQIEEADSFEALNAKLAEGPLPDLVMLDLTMPGVSGFSSLISLRARHPDMPVIVVSARDDGATIRRALDLGASGFISKSSNVTTMREAVLAVLDGDIFTPEFDGDDEETDAEIADLLERLATLTPQQTRVLGMLGEGLLNKQIAYELSVSEATVKAHVSAVLSKLNVDSRTQAVIQLSKLNFEATAQPLI